MWLLKFVGLLAIVSLSNPTNAQETGTVIPLYIYPRTDDGGNAWQQLFDAYRAHPIKTWAIVNVYNGPGDAVDPVFANPINDLHTTGINTLGYVRTDYTRRSQAEIKEDIQRWRNFYNVHGIFFDEMSNDDDESHLRFYKEINDYAKTMGFSFTIGNPGIWTNSKNFDTVDNIVVFETNTGFPSNDRLCSQDTNGKGRGSVSIMPYNIRSLNTEQVRQAKECAGFIYVTDDDLPNPWDTLPNYLTQLFQTLKG